MMNTTPLQAAQQAANSAREALRAALTEASAVEALHLYPLITQAATLQSAIESLRLAVDANQTSPQKHTNESLAQHLAPIVKKPAAEIQGMIDCSSLDGAIINELDKEQRITRTWVKTDPNCWELQK